MAGRADAASMAKHQPKKLPRDPNARAHLIGKIATREVAVPAESAKATAGRKGGQTGGKARAANLVRFTSFRRLNAGVVLEVRITKSGAIGKYTRFVIRRGKLPARLDACLDPARLRPIACPSS